MSKGSHPRAVKIINYPWSYRYSYLRVARNADQARPVFSRNSSFSIISVTKCENMLCTQFYLTLYRAVYKVLRTDILELKFSNYMDLRKIETLNYLSRHTFRLIDWLVKLFHLKIINVATLRASSSNTLRESNW